MEFQIFEPVQRRPRPEVPLEDLNDALVGFEILPPSPEVAAHTLAVDHAEALAYNESLDHRQAAGRIGMLAYYIHPEVNTIADAAEVGRSYETRTEPAPAFLANIAIESIVLRWERSRRSGIVNKLAGLAIRARDALVGPASAPEITAERAIGVASAPETASRFSGADLAFLRAMREQRLSHDYMPHTIH